MRKHDKNKNIRLVNLLSEVNHLRNKGLINEDDNKHHFNLYKSRVMERLIDLQSGQKVVDAVMSGKYDEFIHTNMANGYTIDKTAMSIRDHWYGV